MQDMLLNEGMDNITSAAELEPLSAHLKQLMHDSQGKTVQYAHRTLSDFRAWSRMFQRMRAYRSLSLCCARSDVVLHAW